MPCLVPTCLRENEKMVPFPDEHELAARWFEAIEIGCGYPIISEDDCRPEICSLHFATVTPYKYEEPSKFIHSDGTCTTISGCRMCLAFFPNEDMVAIAGTVGKQKIAFLLDRMGVNFSENNFLQSICLTCFAQLEIFTFLRTKVTKSEQGFQQLLQKSQNIMQHADKPEEVLCPVDIKMEMLSEPEFDVNNSSDEEYKPIVQRKRASRKVKLLEDPSPNKTGVRKSVKKRRARASKTKVKYETSLQEKIKQTCYICNTVYPDANQLMIHLTENHNSESGYRCDECSLEIPMLYTYNRHLSRHNELRLGFQCSICSMRFSCDFRVKIHENKVHGTKHNVKPVVNKLREVVCHQCGKVSDNRRIKDHILEVHQKESLPKCLLCEKTFTTSRSLERHMLVHTGIKPYSCDQCDATFRRLLDYRHHKSIVHDGVNPHVCSECNEEFKNYRQLYNHKQEVHQNKIPKTIQSETCKLCQIQFAKASELMTHIGIQHADEEYPVLKCPHCPKTFILALRLSTHKIMHTDRYACKECGAGHIDKKKLQYHMDLKHPDGRVYACTNCSSTFTSLNQLNEHSVIHTKGKQYQCEFCTKSFLRRFQLTIHIRTHTGEKPFQCDGCLKRFGDDGTFCKHKKRCQAYINLSK
ncbi:zinc finger protein 492-like [Sabethes cyaneus]|uniref:zinc finger protein 492-like n=1 Tax=Sabethes cyaneus TaxID=53552 RepID=UPI00237E396C|nr:zinc finger protein 492-like [Sabethes cyaneus]